MWAAAAPGAGFSETPDFLLKFQKRSWIRNWYEKKLLHLYDCTDWAVNLAQCPTVAYSGDKDNQKQAADIMALAFKREGMELTHIIGANIGHSYTAAAKTEVSRRIDGFRGGGAARHAKSLRFITYTLRYPKMRWINVERLTEHWMPARVDAEIASDKEIRVKTQGVEAFSIKMYAGTNPLIGKPTVVIDGNSIKVETLSSDKALDVNVTFVKDAKGWAIGQPAKGLAKRPLLQGPIDDAFMDRFVMVRPTGAPLNEKSALGPRAKWPMPSTLA